MASPSSVAATMRKKGFAMTLTRENPGTYDPEFGFSGGSSQVFTVYGLLGNYNSVDRAQSARSDGTMIMVGDKKVTIEAGVVVPVAGDTITINGEAWVVVMVDAVNPQGVDLLYKLQVRK